MRLVEFLEILDEKDGVNRFQELLREQKINEGGDVLLAGWTHGKTGQTFEMRNASHFEILQEYWKEMGVPEEFARTAKDAYTGPAQLSAYENGWIRWYYSDMEVTSGELGMSATTVLLKDMAKVYRKLVGELQPKTVLFEFIDPVKNIPDFRRSAAFRTSDKIGVARWFRQPYKHNIYESFRDKTTIPNIDDIFADPEYFRSAKKKQAKVEHMTPQEYIQRAYQGFASIFTDRGLKPITMKELLDSRDEEVVDEYVEAMQRGDKFPMLSLDYSGEFTQEGLHRAMAAIKAGIDTVPVAIVTKVNESRIDEAREGAGWFNVKTNQDISKEGTHHEVPPHYMFLRLFWREMGLDPEVGLDAKDAYAGTAQMQAYHNGWVRWYYSTKSGDAMLYMSAPELLWKSATPLVMKLIKKFQPDKVSLDVIDPTDAYGRDTTIGARFMAHDRQNIMKWTKDPFLADFVESRDTYKKTRRQS